MENVNTQIRDSLIDRAVVLERVKTSLYNDTKQAYIDILDLPIPDEGKQYQLWALVGGKPVDAGVFELVSGIQRVKDIPEADAWAVTLEPKGGSISPTLELMYLLGKNS